MFRTGRYGPYTYCIDGNTYQSSTVFTGVAAGTHTDYVKDSRTCIGFLSGIVVGPTGCEPAFAGNSSSNSKGNQAQVAAAKMRLKIQAYPNPSSTAFTVILDGINNNEKVNISITDVQGRKLYQLNSTNNRQFIVGRHLKPGVYILEVMNGADKKNMKLVKE